MSVEYQPDGSKIIKLAKHKTGQVWTFRVKDLYGENEQEVDIATGEPTAK